MLLTSVPLFKKSSVFTYDPFGKIFGVSVDCEIFVEGECASTNDVDDFGVM